MNSFTEISRAAVTMFDNLTEKFNRTFKRLKGQGKLSEKHLKEALREVRLALLEADVNYKVAKEFVADLSDQAMGKEVMESLTPGQQVVKIVHNALTQLMGSEAAPLDLTGRTPLVFMLVGLQGSGKTTTAGKLAHYLKDLNRKPCLVPADVYRPAAIDQLQILGKQLGVPAFPATTQMDPVEIANLALGFASQEGCDILIVDTAGRLHIDTELMHELEQLKSRLTPREILLVADAMTGQDAVRSAGEFHEALELTGAILTKMDGDARGGAALSIRHVTGVPIKFIGTGERSSEFELFQPDRMVGRILGMGDVLTLIEKAEESFDEVEAKALEKKIRKNQFTLEEFRDQLKMLKKMGPLSSIVSMLPGMGAVRETDLDPKAITRVMAIVDSMTAKERSHPKILNGSRKKRIARGSGQSVQEINRLLKQFAQIRRMMKTMQAGKGRKGARLPFPGR